MDRWGRQQLGTRARDPGRQGAGSIPARPRSVNATTHQGIDLRLSLHHCLQAPKTLLQMDDPILSHMVSPSGTHLHRPLDPTFSSAGKLARQADFRGPGGANPLALSPHRPRSDLAANFSSDPNWIGPVKTLMLRTLARGRRPPLAALTFCSQALTNSPADHLVSSPPPRVEDTSRAARRAYNFIASISHGERARSLPPSHGFPGTPSGEPTGCGKGANCGA